MTENIVPLGVETGCGIVCTPRETRESSSSLNSGDILPLYQVMFGPGIPVVVHSNTAAIPSFTPTTVPSSGIMMFGGTVKNDSIIMKYATGNTEVIKQNTYKSQSIQPMH